MPIPVELTQPIASVVSRSPDVMSGVPVFRGTRVPVGALLDHLEAGDGLDDFLASFPTVEREQALVFLKLAHEAALSKLDETAA